jgi:hypothetical protein
VYASRHARTRSASSGAAAEKSDQEAMDATVPRLAASVQ